MTARNVSLITGANKGIGLEIARQLGRQGHTVLIGARDETRGVEAVRKLRDEGLDAHFFHIDVSAPDLVAAAPAEIERRFGRLDVLINNAGVFLDNNVPPSRLEENALRATFDTNFFGIFALVQALLPLLKKSPAGRIVNLSSTLGSLTEASRPDSPYAGVNSLAYQASKTALNMLTVSFARELSGTNIKVNSVCPGWVQTDMGGSQAPLSVDQGADTPVWLATLPADGPSGGFFFQRKPQAW
jgi:NAD(P)-dependent dehydrogenase (short-subunit alcohol dehydrogenase family)